MSDESPEPSLTLVSWNVHRCIGADGHYDVDRVARVLRRYSADVIALQEVDSSLHVQNGADQLTYLANALGMKSAMGPTMSREYGVYGNALLTRADPECVEEFDLSYRKFEPRGALAINARFHGRRARLINTHLGLKYWERTFQIRRLLGDLTWRDHEITMLLGDFNEWCPYTPNARRLNRSFQDARRLATFPSVWPRFALDRIFVSGNARIREMNAPFDFETASASDHLPLIARLSVTPRTSVES